MIEWYLEQGNSRSFTEALENIARKMGCVQKEDEGKKEGRARKRLSPSKAESLTCLDATV